MSNNDNIKTIHVKSNFGDNSITTIGFEFLATGDQNTTKVVNGRFSMMQGRMYYIPIYISDEHGINIQELDSDEYNIKIPATIADRFDVRWIKGGLAALVPIKHNATLLNNEILCSLSRI